MAKTTNKSTLKALTGSAKQKKLAHAVRDSFLGKNPSPTLIEVFSDQLFMTTGFWIANRNTNQEYLIEMSTRIVKPNAAAYRAMVIVEDE